MAKQVDLKARVQPELAEAFMLAAKLDGADPETALRWCVRAYVARIAGDIGERQRQALIALREGAAVPGPRADARAPAVPAEALARVPADAEPSVERVSDLAIKVERAAAAPSPEGFVEEPPRRHQPAR
ncbi:MAG TPA: hypothetical protein VH025_07670 [Solirubrobacteraceae bacterium]|jgi:hypothetical protein|nr:hypothetical protein [Solirubrobacteraceae bacterium]